MLVLAFDCGLCTLAYCLYDSDNDKIVDLETADLNLGAKCSSNAICKAVWQFMDNKCLLLNQDQPLQVLIEKQPSKNGKMKCVEHTLLSYVTAHGVLANEIAGQPPVSVTCYSPKHKLNGAERGASRAKYLARKSLSVERAQELGCVVGTEWESYLNSLKKPDDVCDALLMAVVYCKSDNKHLEMNPIIARKPTGDAESWTAANVKYMIKTHLYPRKRADRKKAKQTLTQYVKNCPGLHDAITKHFQNLETALQTFNFRV